jgi:hypothetical protein
MEHAVVTKCVRGNLEAHGPARQTQCSTLEICEKHLCACDATSSVGRRTAEENNRAVHAARTESWNRAHVLVKKRAKTEFPPSPLSTDGRGGVEWGVPACLHAHLAIPIALQVDSSVVGLLTSARPLPLKYTSSKVAMVAIECSRTSESRIAWTCDL